MAHENYVWSHAEMAKRQDLAEPLLNGFALLTGAGEILELGNAAYLGIRSLTTLSEDIAVSQAKRIATSAATQSGSYLLKFESGYFYAGKGLESRMWQSINRIEAMGDKLLGPPRFFPAANETEAFINEHIIMMDNGGPLSFDKLSPTYNKIYSPGKKLGGF